MSESVNLAEKISEKAKETKYFYFLDRGRSLFLPTVNRKRGSKPTQGQKSLIFKNFFDDRGKKNQTKILRKLYHCLLKHNHKC